MATRSRLKVTFLEFTELTWFDQVCILKAPSAFCLLISIICVVYEWTTKARICGALHHEICLEELSKT